MDKNTSWIIRIMSIIVIAAIGGGFYLFNENNKRAKKLEAESYCKNDFIYKLSMSNAAKAIQLERMQIKTGHYSKKSSNLPSSEILVKGALDRYDECVKERINR